MSEIEIAEGKVLKLKNVLYRSTDLSTSDGPDKTMRMFDSYMRSNEMTPYGPMIIRVKNTLSNGQVLQKSEMMVQLREVPGKVIAPYDFAESLRIENCLMARYRGPASALQVAYSKMQVYSFEHDLRLSDTVFTVFVEQTPDGNVMADIFAEVIV